MSCVQVKQPGLEMSAVQSELDLSYGQRYQGITIPEAYERLILDTYVLFQQHALSRNQFSYQIEIYLHESLCDNENWIILYRIRGDQQHFVRRDELKVGLSHCFIHYCNNIVIRKDFE